MFIVKFNPGLVAFKPESLNKDDAALRFLVRDEKGRKNVPVIEKRSPTGSPEMSWAQVARFFLGFPLFVAGLVAGFNLPVPDDFRVLFVVALLIPGGVLGFSATSDLGKIPRLLTLSSEPGSAPFQTVVDGENITLYDPELFGIVSKYQGQYTSAKGVAGENDRLRGEELFSNLADLIDRKKGLDAAEEDMKNQYVKEDIGDVFTQKTHEWEEDRSALCEKFKLEISGFDFLTSEHAKARALQNMGL